MFIWYKHAECFCGRLRLLHQLKRKPGRAAPGCIGGSAAQTYVRLCDNRKRVSGLGVREALDKR